MVKILLIMGSIFIGFSAMGQSPETKTETITDVPKHQQIKTLEDLIQRLGETHRESIKAKKMLQVLKKEVADAEQKQMSETLPPAEYDTWKAKQVQVQNATSLKTEEKK